MDQESAFEILKTGVSVFLTGEPGSGKTFVINKFVDWLRSEKINLAVTASTGIAATHIGGVTIHSWSGIGLKSFLTAQEIDSIVSKEKIYNRIKETTTLIIDEVSMLNGKLIDTLDVICRNIREDSKKPFGGMQVVFVGDFFQLPPVDRDSKNTIYAFQSTSWQEAKPLVCYLTDQYRQNDTPFKTLLRNIRTDSVTDADYALLNKQTTVAYSHIEPTHLYTTNKDVDSENQKRLDGIVGKSMVFEMVKMGNDKRTEKLVKHCLSPEMLVLKKGAQVMFTKNNPSAGFMNGTLGVVASFENDNPVVRKLDGSTIKVEKATWEMGEDGKVIASIAQVPLRLAWAITVHKSQGMSLDAAEIDLSKAFVEGQGYVALSRLKTLSGMKISGLNKIALKVSTVVLEKDKEFQLVSNQLEKIFNDDKERFWKQQGKFLKKHSGERGPTNNNDTGEKTRKLLCDGMNVEEVADERKLKVRTIISHLEKLVDEKRISKEDIAHLKVDADVYTAITKAIEQVGDKRLKLIYEEMKERYDYDTIAMARIQWRLEKYLEK